jgi:hypothetical protein
VSAEIKGANREMRRNFLNTILAAALLPAGSLWAAPNFGSSAAPYLSQIHEQAYQIETQADRLEAFARSGGRDEKYSAGLTFDMEERAQKLLALFDQVAAQPGATNDTRMQVKKMKDAAAELMAFAANAFGELQTRAVAIHADNLVSDTGSIAELCDVIRSTAHNLSVSR